MGIDFGVIWAADFDYAFGFDIRLPANRQRVILVDIEAL